MTFVKMSEEIYILSNMAMKIRMQGLQSYVFLFTLNKLSMLKKNTITLKLGKNS